MSAAPDLAEENRQLRAWIAGLCEWAFTLEELVVVRGLYQEGDMPTTWPAGVPAVAALVPNVYLVEMADHAESVWDKVVPRA